MGKDKSHTTAAIRVLREMSVSFTDHPYTYVEKGGTKTFAREYGVDEHRVIKTLIMEDDEKRPLIVLMHGDCEVSTKELARLVGVKRIQPCDPAVAQKHSGYMVGGTSPFGTRKSMKVYMERTILDLPVIFVNGGRRGLLVCLDPREAERALKPILVTVALR